MNEPKGRAPTYPLRLPASIKREAERLAAADGASFNQFVASAVAEKVGGDANGGVFHRAARGRRLGGVRPADGAAGWRAAAGVG